MLVASVAGSSLWATVRKVVRIGAALVGSGVIAACSVALPRNAVPVSLVDQAEVPGLVAVRFWGNELPPDLATTLKSRLPHIGPLATSPGRTSGRPAVNFLALSGGGSDGAFGAGLLNGWTQSGSRPRFEIVTGISAGALTAPFAFLGPDFDPQLKEIWTDHKTDDLLQPQLLSGILGGIAVADSTPMANLIAKYITRRTLDRVAAEYRKGRMLLIGTHNLDAQRFVVWNMGEIAVSRDPRALELFRKVLLASASIPGAFPPVQIEVEAGGQTLEEMHVDGGISTQVFLAPVQLSLHTFDKYYPTPPDYRMYIIRNGKLSPEYGAVEANTFAIAGRSLSSLIKSQGRDNLYEIYAAAQRDGADFNLASIPAAFNVPSNEVFDQTYMRALFDLGTQQARSGYPWMKRPPEIKASR